MVFSCERESTNRCRSIILCALVALPAGLVQGHSAEGEVMLDGRFTPNVGGAEFPPQHREISQVINYPPATSDDVPMLRQRAGKSQAATLTALNSDELIDALGSAYRYLKTTPEMTDKNGSISQRVVFFSYSNNSTVTATIQNEAVSRIDSESAAIDQPPLSSEEQTEAIRIATEHWLSRGVHRVSDLVGYAIQTYQSDGSLFPTRMSYVSFHTESPEAPELMTWVDLSTGAVAKAEIAQ